MDVNDRKVKEMWICASSFLTSGSDCAFLLIAAGFSSIVYLLTIVVSETRRCLCGIVQNGSWGASSGRDKGDN